MKQALRLFFIIVLIKTLDHIIQLLVKIGLIWYDQFNCNFKYKLYYCNKFIKKIVTCVGQGKPHEAPWDGNEVR